MSAPQITCPNCSQLVILRSAATRWRPHLTHRVIQGHWVDPHDPEALRCPASGRRFDLESERLLGADGPARASRAYPLDVAIEMERICAAAARLLDAGSQLEHMQATTQLALALARYEALSVGKPERDHAAMPHGA